MWSLKMSKIWPRTIIFELNFSMNVPQNATILTNQLLRNLIFRSHMDIHEDPPHEAQKEPRGSSGSKGLSFIIFILVIFGTPYLFGRRDRGLFKPHVSLPILLLVGFFGPDDNGKILIIWNCTGDKDLALSSKITFWFWQRPIYWPRLIFWCHSIAPISRKRSVENIYI